MKKTILILLSFLTIINLIVLVIALTDKSSNFYSYRLIIGISFLMFGGFLRQHLSSYNKKNVKK